MLEWPTPRDLRDLRGFLGLTGYYRRFVCNYEKITEPLMRLLKKDAFQWTNESIIAFKKLKEALSSVPILALLDFSKEFVIETDVFRLGLGVMLM